MDARSDNPATLMDAKQVLLDGVTRPAIVTFNADGVVTAITPRDESAARARSDESAAPHVVRHVDGIVAPAPIDIHFHGAGGVSVAPDGDPSALGTRLDELVAGTVWSGVPSARAKAHAAAPTDGDGAVRSVPHVPYRYLATLPIPSRPPADVVAHLAAACEAVVGDVHCAGLRLEGTFINPARAGVWPPEGFHAPDLGLLDELVAATGGPAHDGGALRIVDVAPELPGALALIERAREHGIIVALAHTDATWQQARAAFDAGATLATHTFNAMRPFHHREPGVAAAALVDARVTCELICDALHVHPGALALALRASGPMRTAIVSDASPFAGQPPGSYDWAGMAIVAAEDGTLRDAHGNLAGAALLVPHAIEVLLAAGFDPVDVAIAATVAPLRVLAPDRPAGLAVGDRAVVVPQRDATEAIR